ncbi:hypothetical protein BJ138DRAFT_1141325 [Hygrophoropsis aurantiaca]|uniref:Uncharacterized protein n=1 Tax=Hygrophoropsis aurantiaca TaxID=72124 RepID=A0ACB8AQY3_9AGAM|nr:hypothetical protein BJ138DRAFT_1141325 [Hygrophoropsis aurantiaca]
MPARRPHRAFPKRQNLQGSMTVANAAPTESALLANPDAASSSVSFSIPALAQSIPSNPSPSNNGPNPPASSSQPAQSSASNNSIATSTVVGACVGAFLALVLAITLAIWYNKRSSKSSSRKAHADSPISQMRNAAGNQSRRQSHLEPWARFDNGGEDVWEGMGQMRQRPSSGPMEKLGAMFHRTPSTTSAEKSSDGHGRESIGTMQHFAKYHPGLAAEMAHEPTPPPPIRRFAGRIEVGPAVSWDGETVGGESFLSLQSRLSGTMSPIIMAKSTPPATASEPHKWESAEVMHVDEDTGVDDSGFVETRNPFADGPVKAKGSNPFFNAQEKPRTATNPFADAYSTKTIPKSFTERTESTFSGSSNERAMQSLLAALETSPEDVNERLRVASMQSSFYSRTSTIMSGDEEDIASVTAFPLPPTQVPRGL